MFDKKTEGDLSTYLEMKQYQECRFESPDPDVISEFVDSLPKDRIIKIEDTPDGSFVVVYWGESESNDG